MRIFSFQAEELLWRLLDSGARLRLVEGQLQVKMPGGLSEDLRGEIQKNKAGLLELVQAGEANWHTEQVWESSHIRIPKPDGRVDVWMLMKRLDKPGERTWFVRTEGEKKVEPALKQTDLFD